ncbi:MAG: NAD(P)/FAD-dependent oxidoreductase [Pseudomonadota bacterium]
MVVPDDFEVLIVGAGFSAIICAIQLDALGIPWRIVERQEDWGGTWCLNTYPEARVDITNFIYSFTFEPQYPWEHAFAPREELMAYVRYLVDKHGLGDRAHFRTQVVNARWQDDDARWEVTLEGPDGQTETRRPNVLLSCSGLFSTPRLPDIPGIESFAGEMFHTTNWNHDYDHHGKRVALIGTGSTGSQLAPRVAEEAASLTIYQRTPNWVTPVGRYRAPIPEPRKWLLRHLPGYTQWNRYSHTHASIRIQALQHLDPQWQAEGGRVNEKNDLLRKGLTAMIRHKMKGRPELIEHLIPDFAPLSRRIVVDNGFYDTLLRDDVHLDVTGIEEIQPGGILGKDGVYREYDLIILAAGFDVERYLHPVPYQGRDGKTLEDLWSKDGARAYLTMTLPHFPNFFMMYGPNAAVRASSFHSAVEMLSRYICETIVSMLEHGATSVTVKPEVHDAYNERLDEGMKGMLWEQEKGGNSYYLNRHGKSGVNMPWEMYEFYDFIRAPAPADFEYR